MIVSLTQEKPHVPQDHPRPRRWCRSRHRRSGPDRCFRPLLRGYGYKSYYTPYYGHGYGYKSYGYGYKSYGYGPTTGLLIAFFGFTCVIPAPYRLPARSPKGDRVFAFLKRLAATTG